MLPRFRAQRLVPGRFRVHQELIDFLLPEGPDPDTTAAEAHHHRGQNVPHRTFDAGDRNDHIHHFAGLSARGVLNHDVAWLKMYAFCLSQSLQRTTDIGSASWCKGFHLSALSSASGCQCNQARRQRLSAGR